jgi:hypothetical protein
MSDRDTHDTGALSDAWREETTTLANGITVETICEVVPGCRPFWVVVVKDRCDRPIRQIRCRTAEQADNVHGRAITASYDAVQS